MSIPMMTPEEKKLFDFEIASGMRNRKTGELLSQFKNVSASKKEPAVEELLTEKPNPIPSSKPSGRRGRRAEK